MSIKIAVTSGKGGTGKTMFAVNLAALLAMNDSRVLIIDMNAGLRNVDLCLGLENKIVYDFADVKSNKDGSFTLRVIKKFSQKGFKEVSGDLLRGLDRSRIRH